MAKKWVPIKDATEVLEVSERTIRRWVEAKKYKTRRINNVRHILIEDFPEPKKESEMPKENTGTKQANDGQESNKSPESDREKDLKIAQLIKDLDEQKSLVGWLKQGYEQLNASHYTTARTLEKLQSQLALPNPEVAKGEVIGIDNKNITEGIVGAKKAKFLSDLTNILIIVLLLGLIIAVVVLTAKNI